MNKAPLDALIGDFIVSLTRMKPGMTPEQKEAVDPMVQQCTQVRWKLWDLNVPESQGKDVGMNQSRKMMEELQPVLEQETGKSIGVASDQAEAEDILNRNDIEFSGTTTYEGMKAWTMEGKIVARWDEDSGIVWRMDDAYAPAPGTTI